MDMIVKLLKSSFLMPTLICVWKNKATLTHFLFGELSFSLITVTTCLHPAGHASSSFILLLFISSLQPASGYFCSFFISIHLRLKIVASSREGKPSDQKTKPLALGNLAISGPGKLHKETQI